MVDLNYNLAKLKNLLKDFYVITTLRVVVFDTDMIKIAEFPNDNSEFCSLIRRNPLAEERCKKSDEEGCLHCYKTKHTYSYICHAGLSETVAPIYCGKTHIGYIMVGQILKDNYTSAIWPEVREKCKEYCIEESKLQTAFFKIKTLDTEQVNAVAQILEACAGYLWLSQLITLQENSLPNQIVGYISKHLADNLSSQALCSHFKISRSNLYRIFRNSFGMGIEQLVREERIRYAKELLVSTSLKISEISDRSGFTDYNYFIRIFKKYVGFTPLQYRKHQLNNTK